jgi:hypothetical protein
LRGLSREEARKGQRPRAGITTVDIAKVQSSTGNKLTPYSLFGKSFVDSAQLLAGADAVDAIKKAVRIGRPSFKRILSKYGGGCDAHPLF